MILNLFKNSKDGFSLKNIFGKQLVDASTTNYIQSIFDQIADGSLKVDTLAKSTSKLDKELASYIKTNKDATLTTEGFAKHVESTGTSLTKLSVKSKLAKFWVDALNATLTMGASLLAGFIVEGVISWFDDLTHKSEKLAEAAEKSTEKIRELKDQFKSNKEFVDDNTQRFAELSQGVDEFGSNKSLSTDDYEEFLNISNQLADIFPTLDRVYDDNGNAIVRLNGDVDNIVSSLQNLIETQRDLTNANIATELPAIFDNASEKSKQYEADLEEFKNQRDNLFDSIDYLKNIDLSQSLNNQWIEISDLNTESLYQIKDAYETVLKDAKIAYEEMSATMGVDEYGMSIPIGFSLHITDEVDDGTKKQIENSVSNIIKQYEKEIEGINDKINQVNQQHKQTWNSLNQSIASWLYTDSGYKVLDDSTQKVIQQMVDNVQWSELDFNNWEQAQAYIQNNILSMFTNDTLSSQLKERLLTSLNQGSLSDNDYIVVIQKLQADINEYLKEHNIEVEFNLDFLIADKTDVEQRLKSRIRELIKSPEDKELVEQYFISAGIDTAPEKEAFLDAASGVDTLNEAFLNYNETLSKTSEEVKNLDVINEELDKIQSSYQVVSSAVREYKDNNALSLDTIQSLLSLDDEYLQVLYDENGQLTLNTDAYKELAKARLYDLYVKLSSEAANMLESLESEETAIDELAESIDNLIITKKEDIEASILQAETAILNAQILGENVINRQKLLDKIKNQYELLNTMSDSFNYDDFWGDKNSSSGSNNKFKEEINWIDNSLENINREIDLINDKIANTNSFKERLQLYNDLNEANQRLVDATKNATKVYEKEWIKASNKISAAYKQKIISGDIFSIEEFSNETLSNNVKTALEAYKTWQSSIQEQNKALAQQEESLKNHIKVLLEQEEIKLEINSLDKEEAQTAKIKNSLLYKENNIKANILKYNLQLAKTEEEKLKLQQTYNQELKENQRLIYENNQNEFKNKISYYDSRVQDIQNDIDLAEIKGGQAAVEQYNEQNKLYERQKQIYELMYDNALNVRNAAKYRSDEWEQANQDIQEAENSINKLTIAQLENNRAILELPISQFEKANEILEQRLNIVTKDKETTETALGYANMLIEDEIELLNEDKKLIVDVYDEKIKKLQEEKDALTSSNDERQREINLSNAKYNLDKALRNKTVKVYRAGQGFVYEADQEAVREAQQELDRQVYENKIAELDKSINALNAEKDTEVESIDSKITAWEEYASKLDKVNNSYDKYIAKQAFIATFGESAIEQIMMKDTSVLTTFETALNNIKAEEDELTAKIDANNLAIQQIRAEADAYLQGAIDIEDARKRINEIVTDNQDELDSLGVYIAKIGELSSKWTSVKNDISTALTDIQTANVTAKEQEETVLGERETKLESFSKKATGYYEDIADSVTSAQSSFKELQTILSDAQTTYNDIVTYNNKAKGLNGDNKGNEVIILPDGTRLSKYHNGGIVGKDIGNKKLPEFLMSLADSPLKPNETLAKLLNGEIVLNHGQIGNLFNNLTKVSLPLATNAINRNTNTAMNISIGDVNVYNPDNSDMIVNEIVKELPLKVIQRLNSK